MNVTRMVRMYLMIGCMVVSQQLGAMQQNTQEGVEDASNELGALQLNSQEDIKNVDDVESDWEDVGALNAEDVDAKKVSWYQRSKIEAQVEGVDVKVALLQNLRKEELEVLELELKNEIPEVQDLVAVVDSLLRLGTTTRYSRFTPELVAKFLAYKKLNFSFTDLFPEVYQTKCCKRPPYREIHDLTKRFFATFKDARGETALHIAAQNRYKDLCVLFLDTYDADINAICKYGERPLHCAVQGGDVEIVTILLAHKPEINVRSVGGETPLFHAVRHAYTPDGDLSENHLAIAKLLMQAGADTSMKSDEGKTVFDVREDSDIPSQRKLPEEFLEVLLDWQMSEVE